MQRARRVERSGKTRSRSKERTTRTVSSYELPGKSQPCTNIGDFCYLFYGERKIGKTTLAAEFEDSFLLLFEPGGKSLSCHKEYISDWGMFVNDVIPAIEANPDYCKTIILDGGFRLYDRCFYYMLDELDISKPQDEGWGNAWKLIEREFFDAMERLFTTDKGMIVTAHSEVKTLRKRNGFEYEKLITELGKQAFRYFNGNADLIGYYNYGDKGEHIMTIRGDSHVEAGVRIKKRFLYPDGEPITDLYLGDKDEEDAYLRFTKAFNNQLTREENSYDVEKKVDSERRRARRTRQARR